MSTRITDRDLQAVVDRINRITGSPATPYTRELDPPLSGPALAKGETRPYSRRANIGNYHLSGAYGGVALHRMENSGGGVSDVLRVGHVPKRELYGLMQAFIAWLDSSRQA